LDGIVVYCNLTATQNDQFIFLRFYFYELEEISLADSEGLVTTSFTNWAGHIAGIFMTLIIRWFSNRQIRFTVAMRAL
jgi:hypothetical protein